MQHPFRVIRPGDDAPTEQVGNERRAADRYTTAFRQVQLRTTSTATVIDESFAGCGLLVDDAGHLTVGQRIELDDGGDATVIEGTIVYLAANENGQWRVGIQLDETHVPI